MRESAVIAEEYAGALPCSVTWGGMAICAAALGDADEAAHYLQRLEALAATVGVRLLHADCALARAYVNSCLGGDTEEPLRAALPFASEQGLTPLLTFSQRVTERLVLAALEQGIEVDYARRLIQTSALQPGPQARLIPSWPWPIRIRAFGPLEIEVDGQPLRFGRKLPLVPLALLQLLAGHAGPTRTDRVMTALWPGYQGSAPRGTLDVAVYRLRKLLGTEAAVEQSGKNLVLSALHCWTDVGAFSLLCDRIAELAAAKRPRPSAPRELEARRRQVQRYEQLLQELYRGPFAADAAAPPFARLREALRRRRDAAWRPRASRQQRRWTCLPTCIPSGRSPISCSPARRCLRVAVWWRSAPRTCTRRRRRRLRVPLWCPPISTPWCCAVWRRTQRPALVALELRQALLACRRDEHWSAELALNWWGQHRDAFRRHWLEQRKSRLGSSERSGGALRVDFRGRNAG